MSSANLQKLVEEPKKILAA